VSLAVAVPCPRCGEPWMKWSGSTLPCHARCFWSDELQDDVYRLKLRFPRVSIPTLMRDFDVPVGIIKLALCEGARRAGRVVTRWGR
jgi:hypothetical protein